MAGRTRRITDEELDEAEPLVTPNLEHGEVYWLSSKQGARVFAPTPVRARRVIEAAKKAVGFIGGPVLVWHQGAEESHIVWCEFPYRKMQPTGRSLASFSYTP